MISRVHRRGARVGGLLRYLYGPGKAEEHVNPRLVAAWDGAGELSDLEPELTALGKRDFRRLTAVLEEPVAAGSRPPDKPVWHCSMRLAPEDRSREFSDATWGHMVREMLAEAGIAGAGDDPGLRWVAVRHNDDHVHIVATLVREDGRTDWLRNDYPRCVKATHAIARRYNLNRQVAPADRTAHRRPHPVEVSKARRTGQPQTARDQLRRKVRAAAAAAGDEDEFFDRLRDAGVLVRHRHSTTGGEQITGYAVALPDGRTAEGKPIYFSGGRLAPELTLPKLRHRWGVPTAAGTRRPVPPVDRAHRIEVLREAATSVQAAAEQMHRAAASGNPGAGQAAAAAAADVLTSVAYAVEGDRRGPLHRAAEMFDRAARDTYGKVARATTRSHDMRSMARLVALMGRVSGDSDAIAALALVMDMARLADTLEELRRAQQRLHQADAARQAAAALRAAAAGGAPPGPGPATAVQLPLPGMTTDNGRGVRRGR